MNRFIRHGFILFTLAIAFGSAAVDANGQRILGQILDRMNDFNKNLRSLKADVTMVKHNPQLGESDVSVGKTSYLAKFQKKPMYVRIDWTKPTQEMVSVIGDQYQLYRVRLNQVIEGRVDKAKNNASAGGALAFMNMSRAQLKANYEVEYVGEERLKDNSLTWHLRLTPKARTSYKLADLWVDKDGMPRQSKITEHNSDTTTVLLENIQTNVTLQAEIFKLNYPKNAKIIKA